MSERSADAALGSEAGAQEPAPHGLLAWLASSHPTVAALLGFYIGLGYTILVPALAGAVLTWVFGDKRAEQLLPWVLVTLVVPLVALIPRKTRRLAEFVWIGIITTVIVVVGVGGAVLWFLMQYG